MYRTPTWWGLCAKHASSFGSVVDIRSAGQVSVAADTQSSSSALPGQHPPSTTRPPRNQPASSSQPTSMDEPFPAPNASLPAVPRLYQAELLEEAKKRNIIIRADTGTGKTLVALKLIAWTAARTKANPADHQIQAFLVPTRPLVQQQAQCIQSECPDLRVQAYTGDLQPELWNVDKWHSELNGVDVIVSTAQIFYDLISKGYWKFEDMSLLIFDEAHHCRKNHVYNQIMRSHYHRLARGPNPCRLPKILGLTASPIWDYKDLEKAESDIKSLQSALAAQICEVRKHTEDVAQHNLKPNEATIYYEPSPDFASLSHPPWEHINDLLTLHASPKFIAGFESVCLELGTYAYSLAVFEWLKSLLTIDSSKQLMSGRLVDPSHQQHIQDVIKQLGELVEIDDIPQEQLSSKVIALNKILANYKEKDDHNNFHCIVFVERRQQAQLLRILLERNALLKDFIRPASLTGHGPGNDSDLIGIKMDSKTQNKTVAKFRTGEYNLTIATSVAEEGLDFRSCRVVIRFDPITTWKGYIQSRGRARARDSEYIAMCPSGLANKFLAFVGKEKELKAALYDRPEDELIEDGEEESTPQLICRLADGKDSILTYNAATSLLNDVCQLIPPDEFLPVVAPEYEITCLGESLAFRCQVTLPPMAALPPARRTFTGLEMPTKKDAKRSAAFEACKVLRELGVLNEHFLPQREDKTGQARDADGRELDTSTLSEQVQAIIPNVYGDFRTSPEVWIHKLSFPDDSPAGFSTIGFLCGRHLCIPEGLQLFNHHPTPRSMPVQIEQSQVITWGRDELLMKLKKLETFTRLVMQAAVNRKHYEGRLYFLVAPLHQDAMEINWTHVDTPLIPLSDAADGLRYSYIVAPLRHLSYRLYESCEPSDLSDASPVNLVSPQPSMRDFCKKIAKFHNLGHFYKVVYDMKEEQFKGELVYLETTFQVSNNLSKSEATPVQPYRLVLPLKICKGTHIPRPLWRVFSYLPSLTRLLHDALQATALFKQLETPTISILRGIEALTPPGVGAPWDYQTLETVGDAFLKLATSVHVYLTHLKKGEGDMSYVRAKSVDNAYLRRKAVQANLPGSILSQRFRTDRFRDAQTEDGKELANGNFSRKIPRRVLSDVVEALLGAGYLTGGIPLSLKVGTALDLCFGGTSPWNERELNIGFGTTAQDTPKQSVLASCEALQQKIGYVFKEKMLLVQALTHRSANSFMTNCYEREEWLGDAVIDMWIVEHAYKRFDNATAEELTLARAKVVSNGSLGFLAIKKLNLHEIIMHKSENFEQACLEAIEAIAPFTRIGDYFSDINNLFVVFDPPKILNDVLEAIVGAVFIDSGFDLQTVYRTLDVIFEDVTPGLSQLVARDPLSTMLRLRDRFQCAELRRIATVVSEPNPEGEDEEPISVKVCRIELHGQEIASGRHKSSASVAEQRASLEAIKVMQEGQEGSDSPAETPPADSVWSKCKCKDIAAATLALSNQPKTKKNKKKPAGPLGKTTQTAAVAKKPLVPPPPPMKGKTPKELERSGTASETKSASTNVDNKADEGNEGVVKDKENIATTSSRIGGCTIGEVGKTGGKIEADGRMIVPVVRDTGTVVGSALVEEEEGEEDLWKGKKNRQKRAKRNKRLRAAQACLAAGIGPPQDGGLTGPPQDGGGLTGPPEDGGRAEEPIKIEDADGLADHPPETAAHPKGPAIDHAAVSVEPQINQEPPINQLLDTIMLEHENSTHTLGHFPNHDLSDQPPLKKTKTTASPSSSSST